MEPRFAWPTLRFDQSVSIFNVNRFVCKVTATQLSFMLCGCTLCPIMASTLSTTSLGFPFLCLLVWSHKGFSSDGRSLRSMVSYYNRPTSVADSVATGTTGLATGAGRNQCCCSFKLLRIQLRMRQLTDLLHRSMSYRRNGRHKRCDVEGGDR